MRLQRSRVQNYRSIKDTDWFDVEPAKTILVGPNEAGKTAILKALEHIAPGDLVKAFDPLRDFPRSEYDAFRRAQTDPADVAVVESVFQLADDEKAQVREIHPQFSDCRLWVEVCLSGDHHYDLEGGPERPTYGTLKDSLRRLAVHADSRIPAPAEGGVPATRTSEALGQLLDQGDSFYVGLRGASEIADWLDSAAPYVDEKNTDEMERLRSLRESVAITSGHHAVRDMLSERVPVLVYFSTYTRVRPLLHLGHLADAIDLGAIDPVEPYNFGNYCLLKLLGFSARELSELGKAPEPSAGDLATFESYRAKLDQRDAVLNAASLNLTNLVKRVWQPTEPESNASDYKIRIKADQQYLKVVVEDSLGVEVELDQRSEGFQWLVSFFIVFFAQALDDLKGAILLLDEPGLSLHGLKQRQFRETLSTLAEENQLIFTTHSPFLVGPNELDLVRVVEMTDRETGTRVHNEVMADDPASLLPLQEALGYDLAQSLFAQQRNLVLEGLTDFWYIEATAALLREGGIADLNEKIALVSASGAGKVVYFATILHAHQLKVAALLDSDSAGDQAARQDTLVHALGNRRILRTKDAYTGDVAAPEVEDLLRETLVTVGKSTLGWDISSEAAGQPTRPIVEIFRDTVPDFSKYKLAKAYVRWTRDNSAGDLEQRERTDFANLIERINKATE